jgi:RNA polymerase sigma-70 factor (ECF subfamily)
MPGDASAHKVLLERALGGDCGALAELFERHRGRLEQVVRLRLDRRLQGRLDPADVLQEAYLDVARRFPEYAANPALPFYLSSSTIFCMLPVTVNSAGYSSPNPSRA